MIKKLLVLVAIVSLTACHGKTAKEDLKKDDFKVEDKATADQSFQALENQQQADALNQAQQAKEAEVAVQDRVFFDYNSSDLSEEAKKILDVQAQWLKSDPSIKITIEGHCDERGTREYNIALGDRRANSAKSYLVKNGVEAARIKTVSYGKERLAYFGTDEVTVSKNRRAVAVVN